MTFGICSGTLSVMAGGRGTPVKRALIRLIKERGGYARIIERVAAGETLAVIALDYVVPGHGPISRSFLSHLLNDNEALRPLLQAARKESATVHAEEALHIIDTVPPDRDMIAKARLQAEHRRWLAESYDRETFGPPAAKQEVNLNFGQLHLDALRARIVTPPAALPGPAAKEAEIIDGEVEQERLPGSAS